MSGGLVHESTANQSVDWWTPPEIFEALDETFDLDPCAPPGGVPWIPARRVIAPPEDGLAVEWDGFVWLNPPYGSQTGAWLRKLADHPGGGIALVFSRTDTAWFHDVAMKADVVCFMRGRVKFLRGGEPAGTPGAGSLLFGFGERAATAIKRSGLGLVVELRSRGATPPPEAP